MKYLTKCFGNLKGNSYRHEKKYISSIKTQYLLQFLFYNTIFIPITTQYNTLILHSLHVDLHLFGLHSRKILYKTDDESIPARKIKTQNLATQNAVSAIELKSMYIESSFDTHYQNKIIDKLFNHRVMCFFTLLVLKGSVTHLQHIISCVHIQNAGNIAVILPMHIGALRHRSY